jgi:hypothetical protein
VIAVEDFWLDMGRTQDLVPALLVALIVFSGFPVRAASLTADLRAALASTGPGATLRVVVGFSAPEGGYALRREMVDEIRATRRREVVRRLRLAGETAGASIVAAANAANAQDVQLLWIANSVAMRASPAFIGELAADPRVTQIRLDETMLAPIAYAGLTLPAEWNINQVAAPELWARGFDGSSCEPGFGRGQPASGPRGILARRHQQLVRSTWSARGACRRQRPRYAGNGNHGRWFCRRDDCRCGSGREVDRGQDL